MPLRADLLTPIPGINPSGTDLRYDPVTDKIKEARREELESPQGEWKTALKVADYVQVIQLASDALARRSKDLQLAVWLVDAHVRREGFGVLASCFRLLQSLCREFWDTLYPEIEDGDLEMRAAPLNWIGSRLDGPIRLVPIAANGLSWFRYKESRTVGYASQADTNDKQKAREQAMQDGKLTAEEFDQAVDETSKEFCENQLTCIEEAQSALEDLISFLDEKFGDFSPSFTKVREALQDNAHTVRGFINKKGGPTPVTAAPVAESSVQAAPPVVAAPAPAVAAPIAPPVAATPPPSFTASLEPSDFEDAVKRIAAVARYLRSKDVYDISPYLILRGLRWGEIRYNGPELDRFKLTPPDDELREGLAQSFAASNWNKVLELTERAMELPCGRAWLDLQRYTVKALEGKGKWFVFVADAVRTGVRGLIQDLPVLLDAKLRDNSPAADLETREWIEIEVLSGAPIITAPLLQVDPGPAPSTEPPVVELQPEPPSLQVTQITKVELVMRPPQVEEEPISEDGPADVFEEALQAAQAGQVPQALGLLNRQLASERSGRGRFKRRIQIAHLLMIAGRKEIAQPVLDEIAKEIEERRLIEWEDGEALAYPLSLLLCCTADGEKRQRLYTTICRLDPARALQMPV
jgi:type VI secretion system protein ImpA